MVRGDFIKRNHHDSQFLDKYSSELSFRLLLTSDIYLKNKNLDLSLSLEYKLNQLNLSLNRKKRIIFF